MEFFLWIATILYSFGIRIEEDSILWNCETMGNMICGF